MVFDACDATAVLNMEDADEESVEANTVGFSVVSVLVVDGEDGVFGVELWVMVVVDPKRGSGFIAENKIKNSLT